MARERYIAIDPISSSPVLLHDLAGSPAKFCHAPAVSHPLEEESVSVKVGCGNVSSISTLNRRTEIALRVQFESYDAVAFDTFLSALRTAIAGDQSSPPQNTAGTFQLALRRDGGTYYGFRFCRATAFDYDDGVAEPDGRLLYPSGIPFPEVRLTIETERAGEEGWT